MLGLIKKEFLLIKANIKSLILIMVMYVAMAIYGSFDITFMIPMFVMILLISTFSYDEYNKWDAYAVTLPMGRKNIITAKYLASLILLMLSSIISFLASFISMYFKDTINVMNIFPLIYGYLCGILIVISLMYPLIFKYGSQKGRIGGFVLIVGGSFILGILSKIVNLPELGTTVNWLEDYWIIALSLLTITFLVISYFVSLKIYLKKEF